jgi:hypothetical protein
MMKNLFAICALFALASCTSSAVISGAALGVSYTIDNIAYKTVNHPLQQVEKATEDALDRLDMHMLDSTGDGDERRIRAGTSDLKIDIELTRITARATRIKVDARSVVLLKDKATAAEIIHQIEVVL